MELAKKNCKACTDERLMELITQGQICGFDELYQRYSKRLLRYFFRMLGGDAERAQDLLQNLFLKIVEKPHSFRASGRFSTWIFTVANNMCKNEFRRLSVRKKIEYKDDMDLYVDNQEGSNVEKAISQNEFKKAVFEELAKLDAKKRSTFILRFQEDFSIREISEVLNCSEGTVKSRLFYTIKLLAAKLRTFNSLI